VPDVDPSEATAQFDTVGADAAVDEVAVAEQTNPYLSTISSGRVIARQTPSADAAPQVEQEAKPRPEPRPVRKPDEEPEWYKRAREKAEQKAHAPKVEEDVSKYRSKFADVPMSGKDLHKADDSKKLTPEEIVAAAAPAAPVVAATAPVVAQPTSADSDGRGGGASGSDSPRGVSIEQSALDEHASAELALNPSPSSLTQSSDTSEGRVVQEPEQVQEQVQEPEPEPEPEAAPTPSLRDLSLPILTPSDSGKIAVQQAGLDSEPSLFDPFEPANSSPVSRTGSFAPLGATGVMKPVGEELLQYSETTEDLYIDDADDSELVGKGQESDVHHAPDLMDMPDSRVRSFFGTIGDRFSGKKNESLDTSPTDWLGVDEDFDARKEGSQIGSWDNFGDDDDTWSGGAYGGESEEENVQALQALSRELVDREVWFVALGAQESKNAGLRALVKEHHQDFKGAIVINVEGVGLGELNYTVKEGTFRQANTDHRLQNIISNSARDLGIKISPLLFKGYSTAATKALDLGIRAISIIGLDGDLPQGWRWTDDQASAISEESLEDAVELLLEVVKNS
jgi:hypothetical protein